MSSAGLMVPPPKRTCDDARCPFHGHVKVSGKILTGKVVSISDKQTVVIQREFLQRFRSTTGTRGGGARSTPTCLPASRSRRGTWRHDSRVQAARQDHLVRGSPVEGAEVGMSTKSRAVSAKGVEEFKTYITRLYPAQRCHHLRRQHRCQDPEDNHGLEGEDQAQQVSRRLGRRPHPLRREEGSAGPQEPDVRRGR